MPDWNERRATRQAREAARQLRQPQTPAEVKLWARLRGQRLAGFKFRRQHPVGRFIVDFCCPAHKLAVEIDGGIHALQEEYDAARSQWLSEQGYRVIRFTNDDVFERLEQVLDAILLECQKPD